MSEVLSFPRANVIALTPINVREDRAVFRRTFDGRFDADGASIDFTAYNDACDFLRRRGFSIGPACDGKPSGVMYGSWVIAKWRDLLAQDQADLHGTVTGDRRKGPVRVAIFFNAPAFAIAAVSSPDHAEAIVTAWSNQQ